MQDPAKIITSQLNQAGAAMKVEDERARLRAKCSEQAALLRTAHELMLGMEQRYRAQIGLNERLVERNTKMAEVLRDMQDYWSFKFLPAWIKKVVRSHAL